MWRITFGKKLSSFASSLATCAVVLLSVAAARAQIQVNIVEPALNAAASGSLYVRATVSSVFEVSSVTAQVEGQLSTLKYSQPLNAWTNVVPLTGLAFGSHTLVVTAQEFFGGTAQAMRSFSVDNPPVLTVAAPLNDTVIRGQVYVEATASDDGPSGAVIRVYNQFEPFRPSRGLLLVGTNNVKGLVNVTSILSGTVVITATDSAGQTRFIPRRAWVELSSNLVENATASGRILDFNASRTLYTVSEDVPVVSAAQFNIWTYGSPQPRIIDNDTGEIRSAEFNPGPAGPGLPPVEIGFGFLGVTGAFLGVFPQQPQLIYGSLSRWSGDKITGLGPFDGVARASDLVAWRWSLSNPNGPGIRLLSIADTNQLFVIPSVATFDLAPNYDVVYAESNHVFRNRPASTTAPYTNRTTTQLTSGDGGASGGVVSDGTNVVYARGAEIILITTSGEEVLASPGSGQFKANNGWVAYTKPGTSGQAQIWTRSPAGTQQQRTFFNTSSTLESVGPNGEVTFLNNGRYISLLGVQQPVWVNSGQGRVRWDAGKLLVILGRSVLEFRMGQLRCAALNGGGSRLTFTGPNGFSYTVQGSTDLKNWNDLWTFAHTTGSISWTNSPASAPNFYRAVTASSP